MDFNRLPLWSAFSVVSIISFFFKYHPDYDINYLLSFNVVMWVFVGLFYVSEFAYKKIKKK